MSNEKKEPAVDAAGGGTESGPGNSFSNPQSITNSSLGQHEPADLARAEIRRLLSGDPPDGRLPGDFGDWYASVVAPLQAAHQSGGTLAVRSAWGALTRAQPSLIRLVAEEENAAEESFLLTAGAHDEGNAQCILRLYGDRFLYVDALGWLIYNGRYWDRETAEAQLDRAIIDTLLQRVAAAAGKGNDSVVKRATPDAYRKRACKDLFQSLVAVSLSDFDRDPDLLNVNNGVLDLRTGELEAHDPAQRFTYCLPVDYEEAADPSPWLEFLSSAIDDQELIDYLQEAIGYSLTGHTREEVLFYIYGPTRSGKGVFIETLMSMLGHKPLAAEVDFGTFTATRDGDTQNFDLAPLKPCRFVAASESRRYSAMNEAKLKALTGGNEIYCAFKHRDHFSYRPQFKIWLSSNHPVNADPDDDAVWYRIRVIEFPYSFAGREDKLLKDTLRRPEVLRGLLIWAAVGAIRWYGRAGQGLQTPAGVEAAGAQAREELDMVGQWVLECVSQTGNEADFVPNKDLYASYETWCDENGVRPKQQRSLTMALKKKGFRAGEQRKVNGIKHRGCFEIRLIV